MTYASIEEAWGGVSGSNMLGLPTGSAEGAQNRLTNSVHPNHKKQLALRKRQKRAEKAPRWKTEQDQYQCTYGSPGMKENCNKVFHRNQEYNQQKKNIVNGYPGYTPPYGGQFPVPPAALLPQYPWYPDTRYGYLNYGPQVSATFYSPTDPQSGPYGHVKEQIQQYHRSPQGSEQYQVPIGHYYPVGFFPGYYNEGRMWAPSAPGQRMAPGSPPPQGSGVEHFTNETGCSECANCSNSNSNIKNLTIVFIFVLIILAVILCLFLIGLANFYKNKSVK